MPKATRQPTPPLVQIAWMTKKKGRTRTVMITLGGPVAALLLLLGGAHFNFTQNIARAVTAALGAGR
jgi:hypothetical protein